MQTRGAPAAREHGFGIDGVFPVAPSAVPHAASTNGTATPSEMIVLQGNPPILSAL